MIGKDNRLIDSPIPDWVFFGPWDQEKRNIDGGRAWLSALMAFEGDDASRAALA